jgi:amidase
MTVETLTESELAGAADQMGLDLTSADLKSFVNLMAGSIASYNVVDGMVEDMPRVPFARTGVHAPSSAENPHNAWYWKTSIAGSPSGKLSGKRVVLKDNIMLAGVPMMNGSATLEGYVPEIDATVVTRVLEAGGTIVGKANTEAFCLSSSSHSSAKGQIHNPHRQGYSAGGSSSGCAVLVSLGEVDMAIGSDQGGSIRIPAALCGIYGMKPTWGLVPYSGIMLLEVLLDHAGPMTATVHDNALLLEAIAGDDGYDPRQKSPTTALYSESLVKGVPGLKIAVVREAFGLPGSEPVVDESVRAAARSFQHLGAVVETVSIPQHLLGPHLWRVVFTEGLTQTMMWGDGFGMSRSDLYVTSLMDFHRGWRHRASELSETTKYFTLLGTCIHRRYGSRYYAKALNLARQLTAAYNAMLEKYDLLLMPTVPSRAKPLPPVNASREASIGSATGISANTSPFDLTHHPAMSIPCGQSDGLPIGLMLVGRAFDEPTIYRAAAAFEQCTDWRK